MSAIPQSDLLMRERAGGFANRPYLSREIELGNEETKVACRRRVADFILAHHDTGRLRLFSFPSAHWRFEHLIDTEHTTRSGAKCEFVGVEQDIGIVRESLKWMPGEKTRLFDRGFRQMKFAGACSNRAWLVHMDCATFVRLGQRGVVDARDKCTWHTYRHWSAVWLDFTGQLSQEIELTLPKIGAGCSEECPDVPIAVTILSGREPRHIGQKLAALDAKREEYVAALLDSGRHRNFHVKETFEYVSGPGSTMLTVMGILRAKPVVDPSHDDHEPAIFVHDHGTIEKIYDRQPKGVQPCKH